MEMTKHLIEFMENQKINELSTTQEIGNYNVYVTIEEKEEVEYEEEEEEE